MLFAFVWTFLLGWLCNKGFKTLSWVLVLLPYIFIALGMLGIYAFSHEHRQLLRALHLQGAYGQEAFTEGNSAHPLKHKKAGKEGAKFNPRHK
jgi:hypothetical protein